MPIAELEKYLNSLNKENYDLAEKFIIFLSDSQKAAHKKETNKANIDVSRRFGVAGGGTECARQY